MAVSIKDLLLNKDFDEPKEVQTIKDFIRKRFDAPASVTIQPKQIVINVKSAALAGALRMHVNDLKRLCNTDKKFVIRIS